jgi:aldose 1-epimerase
MKHFKVIALGLLALQLASCQAAKEESNVVLIPAENFQQVIDGKPVDLYTLTNKNGMVVQVTNFGTRIVNIWVPDKDGVFRDVVLGHNTIGEYQTTGEKYFGATVGRYANRIAGGKFTLDGTEYQLANNDGQNALHGGPKGYFDVVFDAQPYKTDAGEDAVLFTYHSPDGEMGYPGNLELKIRMVVSGTKNELEISYEATTDAPTIVNLSNHSYFNLSGEGSPTIEDHQLKIIASNFTPTDATLIPTGEILPVGGTPLDFTEYHVIGERIGADYEPLHLGQGYDHNWVLDKNLAGIELAAEVYSPESGILMEVYTDEPGIQFYSGNFMTGAVVGKSGKNYPHRSALCLETQKFPDSPNHENFPSTTLRPGETYSSVCHYNFTLVGQPAE